MQNGSVEILDIGRYPSGGQNYKIKCLDCGYIRNVSKNGLDGKAKCIKCSRNTFRISEDKSYWIGLTQNNEEFWFDGDEDLLTEIKSYTWRKTAHGYFQNRDGTKLHRLIMGVSDSNIIINHLGGEKYDNRKSKLSLSSHIDNSIEKKISSQNKSGVTGLMKRGKNDKWVGCVQINGIDTYTSYKVKEEALIDLLIVQKHYGFRHNVDLYPTIENIDQERVDEVLGRVEKQLSRKISHSISSSNLCHISEDGTHYICSDKNNKTFKIDLADKEIVEQGIWYLAKDKITGRDSVLGGVIVNGLRKSVRLHRFLFGMIDKKYKNIQIGHINGDATDNRKENLEITNSKGVNKKKSGKGFYIRESGNFRAYITADGKKKSKTFNTQSEAEEWHQTEKQKDLSNRLVFASKNEVDIFLNENQQIKN